MTSYASFSLSRQLYNALGRPNVRIENVSNLYAVGKRGRCLGLASQGYNAGDWSNFIPAFGLDELFSMAERFGHNPIKFRQEGKKTIITCPPCNHIEAGSRADALAKLLIRSLKRGAV